MARRQADYGNYMTDCIHLHACRCLHKRYRIAGAEHVARSCNEECRAYQRAVMSLEACEATAALRWARDGADGIRRGYDEYDVWCLGDIPVYDAYVIEDGPYCTSSWKDEIDENPA